MPIVHLPAGVFVRFQALAFIADQFRLEYGRSYVVAVASPFRVQHGVDRIDVRLRQRNPRRSRIASKISLSVSMSFPAESFAHAVVDIAEQLRRVAGDAR
jgi:2-methylcitrate dehydratase PrpD